MQHHVGNLSVLVVDDHRFMQQVIRMMLNGLGIKEVTPALTVDEGIRILASQSFDIVIADYLMGTKTGAEFTRLARAEYFGGKRFVPIIACTADTTPRTVAELRDAGADEILCKPVSPRSLYNKMAAVTNMRRQFVTAPNFFGPDRRRRELPVRGGERRSGETEVV